MGRLPIPIRVLAQAQRKPSLAPRRMTLLGPRNEVQCRRKVAEASCPAIPPTRGLGKATYTLLILLGVKKWLTTLTPACRNVIPATSLCKELAVFAYTWVFPTLTFTKPPLVYTCFNFMAHLFSL